MEENVMRDQAEKTVLFRWKYVILPVGILIVTLILIAVFYAMLPPQAGYLFNLDGTVSKIMSRVNLVLWLGGIQLVLTLMAVFIVRTVVATFNRYAAPDDSSLNPAVFAGLMGNMIGLPQLIVFFAMIDIFSYNSFEIHFLPLWLNALIFLLAGGIFLSIFFIRALLQVRRSNKE